MEQETLTVKFQGQQPQINVQTFAYSVLNFATVIKEVNKKISGKPIEIYIKAPKKGSIIVDLVATIIQQDTSLIPETVSFMANLIEVTGGVYLLHKFISGKKIKKKEEKRDKIEIELEDGSTMIVADKVYNIYSSNPAIPNGISQHFSALNEDPAVSKFEVIKKNNETIIEVDREDYARLAIKKEFDTENSKTVIESANLYVYKVVFDRTDRKWEFYYNGNKISANIIDNEFYALIDKGKSFSKGDQLYVDLRINKVLDESVGIYVNQSYQVVKVKKHIKRSEPEELPFNKKLDD